MKQHIIQIDDDVRIIYQHDKDFHNITYWTEILDWEADEWYKIDCDQVLYSTTIFDRFMSHIVFTDINTKKDQLFN